MKIDILKTHQASGEWVHAGIVIDVDEDRAKELIRNGLAAEVRANIIAKSAPDPKNKMASEPKSKSK